MGLIVVDQELAAKQVQLLMDHQYHHHHQLQQQQGSQSSSTTKIERRIVEKNRRNQMKILYSKLDSLIPPSQNSKEIQTLPDQVDEAINHIKSLESKLKKLQEKKKSLLNKINDNNNNGSYSGKKRSYSCTNTATGTLTQPRIQVHEIGPVLEVVLVTGLDGQFVFYELVRILAEERADIVNAKFSVAGDSIFYVVHAEIAESIFGAAKLSERLKRFVSGSVSNVELQQEWWEDFEIQPEMLGLI